MLQSTWQNIPDLPDIPGYVDITAWPQGGGMGELYRARQEKTGEEVVIKMIKIPEDGEELYSAERFANEKIVMVLEHDHILKAMDHGSIDFRGYRYNPYLVFPFIIDGSLDVLIRTEQPWKNPDWPLLEIVDIIEQVAEGLFYLHQLNPPIVHRDIKPENLLWKRPQIGSRRVHVWVSDFGIAHWEQVEKTRPIGTPSYMSPEQVEGRVHRTIDQYALAIVARYLLTGSDPKHMGYPIPPPEAFIDPLPTVLNPARLHSEKIDEVFQHALSKSPGDRFTDVLVFAHELKRAIKDQEYSGSSILSSHLQQSSDFYSATTEPALSSRSPHPQIDEQLQPDVKMIFPNFSIEARSTSSVVNDPVPTGPPPFQEPPPHSIKLPRLGLQKIFSTPLPNMPSTITWSPDGQYLLCSFIDSDAPRLIDRTGGNRELKGLYGHVACWSPDSRYIAFGANTNTGEATISIWDSEIPTRGAVTRIFGKNTFIDGLAWSNRGQLAAWINYELQFYELSKYMPSSTFPDLFKSVSFGNMECSEIGTLQWSPDGSVIAAAAKNGAFVSLDFSSLRIQEHIPASGKEHIYSLVWIPNSRSILLGFSNKRVVLWDTHLKREVNSWNNLSDIPNTLSISPTDFSVTVATDSGLVFGKLDQQESRVVASYPGRVLAAWSPLGELATIDEQNDSILTLLQGR